MRKVIKVEKIIKIDGWMTQIRRHHVRVGSVNIANVASGGESRIRNRRLGSIVDGDDVTIVDQIIDPSRIAPIIPASIDSSPSANIVEEPPIKLDDVDVEFPVGNVKDYIQKFELTEVFDMIDMLEIPDSSDDMLCNLSKLVWGFVVWGYVLRTTCD